MEFGGLAERSLGQLSRPVAQLVRVAPVRGIASMPLDAISVPARKVVMSPIQQANAGVAASVVRVVGARMGTADFQGL